MKTVSSILEKTMVTAIILSLAFSQSFVGVAQAQSRGDARRESAQARRILSDFYAVMNSSDGSLADNLKSANQLCHQFSEKIEDPELLTQGMVQIYNLIIQEASQAEVGNASTVGRNNQALQEKQKLERELRWLQHGFVDRQKRAYKNSKWDDYLSYQFVNVSNVFASSRKERIKEIRKQLRTMRTFVPTGRSRRSLSLSQRKALMKDAVKCGNKLQKKFALAAGIIAPTEGAKDIEKSLGEQAGEVCKDLHGNDSLEKILLAVQATTEVTEPISGGPLSGVVQKMYQASKKFMSTKAGNLEEKLKKYNETKQRLINEGAAKLDPSLPEAERKKAVAKRIIGVELTMRLLTQPFQEMVESFHKEAYRELELYKLFTDSKGKPVKRTALQIARAKENMKNKYIAACHALSEQWSQAKVSPAKFQKNFCDQVFTFNPKSRIAKKLGFGGSNFAAYKKKMDEKNRVYIALGATLGSTKDHVDTTTIPFDRLTDKQIDQYSKLAFGEGKIKVWKDGQKTTFKTINGRKVLVHENEGEPNEVDSKVYYRRYLKHWAKVNRIRRNMQENMKGLSKAIVLPADRENIVKLQESYKKELRELGEEAQELYQDGKLKRSDYTAMIEQEKGILAAENDGLTAYNQKMMALEEAAKTASFFHIDSKGKYHIGGATTAIATLGVTTGLSAGLGLYGVGAAVQTTEKAAKAYKVANKYRKYQKVRNWLRSTDQMAGHMSQLLTLPVGIGVGMSAVSTGIRVAQNKYSKEKYEEDQMAVDVVAGVLGSFGGAFESMPLFAPSTVITGVAQSGNLIRGLTKVTESGTQLTRTAELAMKIPHAYFNYLDYKDTADLLGQAGLIALDKMEGGKSSHGNGWDMAVHLTQGLMNIGSNMMPMLHGRRLKSQSRALVQDANQALGIKPEGRLKKMIDKGSYGKLSERSLRKLAKKDNEKAYQAVKKAFDQKMTELLKPIDLAKAKKSNQYSIWRKLEQKVVGKEASDQSFIDHIEGKRLAEQQTLQQAFQTVLQDTGIRPPLQEAKGTTISTDSHKNARLAELDGLRTAQEVTVEFPKGSFFKNRGKKAQTVTGRVIPLETGGYGIRDAKTNKIHFIANNAQVKSVSSKRGAPIDYAKVQEVMTGKKNKDADQRAVEFAKEKADQSLASIKGVEVRVGARKMALKEVQTKDGRLEAVFENAKGREVRKPLSDKLMKNLLAKRNKLLLKSKKTISRDIASKLKETGLEENQIVELRGFGKDGKPGDLLSRGTYKGIKDGRYMVIERTADTIPLPEGADPNLVGADGTQLVYFDLYSDGLKLAQVDAPVGNPILRRKDMTGEPQMISAKCTGSSCSTLVDNAFEVLKDKLGDKANTLLAEVEAPRNKQLINELNLEFSNPKNNAVLAKFMDTADPSTRKLAMAVALSMKPKNMKKGEKESWIQKAKEKLKDILSACRGKGKGGRASLSPIEKLPKSIQKYVKGPSSDELSCQA